METYTKTTHNPWFSMWTKPRETMREILDNYSGQMILILAVIGGINQALNQAVSQSKGDKMSLQGILLAAIIGGAIGGIINIYLSPALLKWTGKSLGGEGSFDDIQKAVAWSNIPIIWGMIIWIPEMIIFKQELFTRATPIMDSSVMLTSLYYIFMVFEFIILIWSTVVGLKCVGEAQKFSAWKALANILLVLLALILIFVPLVFLAIMA